MQTKLTLRIDEHLIASAKRYARRNGRSLSRMVADYFAVLTSPDQPPSELTPGVVKLKGALGGTGVSAKDYGEYRERKHA